MLRAYGFLLRFYPRRHQSNFSQEMQSVFAQAAEEERRRGFWAYTRFLFREALGLLAGSGTEWLSLVNDHAPSPVAEAAADAPPAIAQARLRIAINLRRMEHAIAHHQFARARFYAEVDREERARLETLLRDGPAA